MKYPEENLLSDRTLRREMSIEFYQSGKWCQGEFEADDAAFCQGAVFVVFCKYESCKLSSLFLLTPGKRGSGEPSQPDPAIHCWVDSNRCGRSAAAVINSAPGRKYSACCCVIEPRKQSGEPGDCCGK